MSSEQSFGYIFSLFFFATGLYLILKFQQVIYWPFGISLIFLLTGIYFPRALKPLNKIWFRLGLLLGNIVAPLVMAILFFLIITPIGLIMRVVGKDLLKLKANKSINSYWIKRDSKEEANSSMKNQF